MLFLWGCLAHCPLKVNSLASHVVALSELNCILTSMGAVTVEDVLCLFPVYGWFEWPSSGVVWFYNHKSLWCCRCWLRICVWLRSVGCRPTHSRGGTLDLQVAVVPDQAQVAVVAPVLQYRICTGIYSCGAILDLPWHDICSADNPVEVLDEHLLLLVRRFVPNKVICVRN